MSRPLRVIAFALATTAAITGCGGGQGRHGTVTGVFLMVGGPAGARARLPGRVIATSTRGQRFAVTVSTNGRFTINVPPGTYHLTGYSPLVHVDNEEMRCVAAHATQIQAGQSAHDDVYCSVR